MTGGLGAALAFASAVQAGDLPTAGEILNDADTPFPALEVHLASMVGLLVCLLADETSRDPAVVWQDFTLRVSAYVERGVL